MHCQIYCCEWYQWSAGIYLHSNTNTFSCNMIPRPYCIVGRHAFNTALLIIAQTYFFQKCRHNCYILTIRRTKRRLKNLKYTVYACIWIHFISDIRDIKDILVRIEHKQFEFSTEVENLKTNQTGENRITRVTIVKISHCQKVENISHYNKYIKLRNI